MNKEGDAWRVRVAFVALCIIEGGVWSVSVTVPVDENNDLQAKE